METNTAKTKNIAILIDAENVLPASADLIFDHAASLGNVVRREIFGASSALGAWVSPVLKYAIHPNLTIKASKGKNSSDIALVIGAMDLLVEGGVDTVIIASSDSDFSALSVRLRTAGIEVIGMGMEKSNELWRTACSTFVVLNQKAQAAAKAPAKPAARTAPARSAAPAKEAPKEAEPAPTKAAGRAARAAAMTHEERVAVIAGQIEKRLKGHDKVQVSNLFPSLNQLAEYRADKQDAGKKPLNYLTSTFGDLFHFEEAADGQSYVSLPGAPVAPEAPVMEEAPAVEEAPVIEEAPAIEEATAVEEAPAEAKKPARRSRRGGRGKAKEAPAEEAPVEAAPAEEAPAEEPVQVVDGAPDPLAILLGEGIEEDVARQIVAIFTESDSLRQAYNKLRSVFGNTAGRDYYQQVKDIASRQ